MRFVRPYRAAKTLFSEARRRRRPISISGVAGGDLGVQRLRGLARNSLRVTGGERGVELGAAWRRQHRRGAQVSRSAARLGRRAGLRRCLALAPFVDRRGSCWRGACRIASGTRPLAGRRRSRTLMAKIRVKGDPAHLGRRVRDHLIRRWRLERSSRRAFAPAPSVRAQDRPGSACATPTAAAGKLLVNRQSVVQLAGW